MLSTGSLRQKSNPKGLLFLFCRLVCILGKMILDNTKLTPGHVTTIFVSLGTFLDIFNIYEMAGVNEYRLMGLFMRIFID